MLHIARTAVLVLGCCAAAARAQEDEGAAPAASELARVQRDQSRIGVRIAGLREKMERLAQRYEAEGRTRNATLLREALSEFDAKQVPGVARDLERNLSQSNLSSVEQQDALVASLEQVYAVLRDRKDADELQRQADLARKAVDELGFLAKNERKLLSRTRAATDQPGSLIQEALELARQLQESLSSADQATASTQAAEQSLGDSALADALVSEQRALSRDPGATADTQALLQEALELLRERLEQPMAAEGEAGAVLGDELLAAAETDRGAAREAAAEAAEAMKDAREKLERAEAARSGKPSNAGKPGGANPAAGETANENPAGANAGDEAGSDAAAGENAAGEDAAGETAAGEKAAGEKAAGEKAAGEKAAGEKAAGENASGETAADEAAAGEGAAGSTPSGEKAPGKPAAGGTPAGAQPAPGSPPTPPKDGKPTASDGATPSPEEAAARQAMEEATAALEETRDALERSERSLNAARNRARSLALASSAQAGEQAESMEELAERLEAVTPDAGPELLDRTRELLAELQKAADAIERGESGAAGEAQQEARTSLDDLIRQLQARAGENPDPAPRTPDAAELESLAAQQQELQRQVNELMARLEELPDQEYREASERASKAMAEAEAALREGRTEEAAVREEEAAEQLEEAQQKLSGERDRYEQLRQEEVLFQVAEELKSLLEKQDAISSETLELDAGRTEDDRLGRSQRRTAMRLSSEEKDLSVQAEVLRVALEKDGSVAFTFALERCRDDLTSAAELLADEQTGFLVQSVQGDVRQRVVDLLAVLEAEQERRRNAKAEPPPEGEPQQQQKNPLVPTIAELLLIQRMEQAALARLESFQRATPGLADPDGVDPVERELLGRWALEHTSVTELFRRMIPDAGAPGPHGEAPPEGGEGDEGGAPPAPDGGTDDPGGNPDDDTPPPGTEKP